MSLAVGPVPQRTKCHVSDTKDPCRVPPLTRKNVLFIFGTAAADSTIFCDCLPLCSSSFCGFDQPPKALMFCLSKSNLLATMTAKKRKLHERKGLDFGQNCQIYLQVIYMVRFLI